MRHNAFLSSAMPKLRPRRFELVARRSTYLPLKIKVKPVRERNSKNGQDSHIFFRGTDSSFISHLPPIREANCPIRRSTRCRRTRRFIQDCEFRALVGNNRSSNTVNWTDRSGGRGRLFRGSRLDGYLAPFAAATHLWLYSFPYKERPGLGIACGIESL